MAKRKGKSKGSPTGLDFDKKVRLEQELHATLFQSGGRRIPDPDLENGGAANGGSSSGQGNLGSSDKESEFGLGGSDKVGSPPLVGSGEKSPSFPDCPPFPASDGPVVDPNPSSPTGQARNPGGFSSVPGSGARSFAQVARGSRRGAISERLNHIPHVNGDCIQYKAKDVAESEEAWAATLLGAVMGPVLSRSAISGYFARNWKVRKPKVFIKSSGLLVIQFDFAADINWVLEHGPWSIGSSPLLLKQWIPGATMDWSFFESVPIWVRIPDIPPTFCSNSMLSMIGSGIGSPLCVDEYTATTEMLSFARLLVEVNVAQTRRKYVKLVSEKGVECALRIIFEWLPWSCSFCNCFGHVDSSCPGKKLVEKSVPDDVKNGSVDADKPPSSTIVVNKGEGDHPYGCPQSAKADAVSIGVHTDNQCSSKNEIVTECTAHEGGDAHILTSTVTTSIGIQTELYCIGESEAEGNREGKEQAETITTCANETDKADDVLKADPESSKICAAIVATAWAKDSGLSATKGGRMRISRYNKQSPKRWQEVGGIKKGSYPLRGTSNRLPGDIRVSLTMDELYNALSAIKDPLSGDKMAEYFAQLSEYEDDEEGKTDEESYHPG